MANHYFEFKQFRVEQGGASMKVGTDGVLLGAWAPFGDGGRMLDVGTGTGLIALMLAQRFPNSTIDAIEIDGSAAKQASDNVLQSPWSNRIEVKNISLQDYAESAIHRYDWVVCNPPFFVNSLQSPHHGRNLARHTVSLSLSDLADGVVSLLNNNGGFAVVLPPDQMDLLKGLLFPKGYHPAKWMDVVPVPSGQIKRVLAVFSKLEVVVEKELLVVESNGRHGYSDEYKRLTQDFYLKF